MLFIGFVVIFKPHDHRVSGDGERMLGLFLNS